MTTTTTAATFGPLPNVAEIQAHESAGGRWEVQHPPASAYLGGPTIYPLRLSATWGLAEIEIDGRWRPLGAARWAPAARWRRAGGVS